jgi:hypothetical protein
MPDNPERTLSSRVEAYHDLQRQADYDMTTFAHLIDNDRGGVNSVVFHPDGQRWRVTSFSRTVPVDDHYWPGERKHETQTWYEQDGEWKLYEYEKHGHYPTMEAYHVRRVKGIVGGDWPEVESDD